MSEGKSVRIEKYHFARNSEMLNHPKSEGQRESILAAGDWTVSLVAAGEGLQAAGRPTEEKQSLSTSRPTRRELEEPPTLGPHLSSDWPPPPPLIGQTQLRARPFPIKEKVQNGGQEDLEGQVDDTHLRTPFTPQHTRLFFVQTCPSLTICI